MELRVSEELDTFGAMKRICNAKSVILLVKRVFIEIILGLPTLVGAWPLG